MSTTDFVCAPTAGYQRILDSLEEDVIGRGGVRIGRIGRMIVQDSDDRMYRYVMGQSDDDLAIPGHGYYVGDGVDGPTCLSESRIEVEDALQRMYDKALRNGELA